MKTLGYLLMVSSLFCGVVSAEFSHGDRAALARSVPAIQSNLSTAELRAWVEAILKRCKESPSADDKEWLKKRLEVMPPSATGATNPILVAANFEKSDTANMDPKNGFVRELEKLLESLGQNISGGSSGDFRLLIRIAEFGIFTEQLPAGSKEKELAKLITKVFEAPSGTFPVSDAEADLVPGAKPHLIDETVFRGIAHC